MLKRINQVEPNITSVDINKINEYLDSGGWITEHNVTRNLEDRISSLLNRKYAVLFQTEQLQFIYLYCQLELKRF